MEGKKKEARYSDSENAPALRAGATHRDLLPENMCPSLMMKHILTHSLDDVVYDDRDYPGDGYYW